MTVHHILRDIENRSENAIPQELALMRRDVLALRPSLNMEERGHADGLLLKLDSLHSAQQLKPGSDKPADLSHCLAFPLSAVNVMDSAEPQFVEAAA